jgi:uncharacterized protein YceK
MNRYTKSFFLLALMLTVASCSSVSAKSKVGFGQPYSGIEHASNFHICTNVGAAMVPPLLLLTVPMTIIDFSTSFVLDTILLPIDLVVPADETKKLRLCNGVDMLFYKP